VLFAAYAAAAGLHLPAAGVAPPLMPQEAQQSRRKLQQAYVNGQECDGGCIPVPDVPNQRIPAHELVGCNNSYCVNDISSVPCMDDPITGCMCNATNNSCGVLPVDAAMQLGRIPMMKGVYFPRAEFDPDTSTTTVRNWQQRYNLLPRQLLQYSQKWIFTGDALPYSRLFGYLPVGFGCPDWQPLQQSLSSSEGQWQTESYMGSWLSQPGQEASTLPNVTCWVDARVAVNLLTFATLDVYNPCWDVSGGTLNTWRSGYDGRPVTERLQVRF
jgi:hypothetical protein